MLKLVFCPKNLVSQQLEDTNKLQQYPVVKKRLKHEKITNMDFKTMPLKIKIIKS